MRRAGWSIIFSLLFLAAFILPALSQESAVTTVGGITVDGADSTWHSSVNGSEGLAANLQAIQPGVYSQFSNATLKYPLLEPPLPLQGLVQGLVHPVSAGYTSATLHYRLRDLPLPLRAQLETQPQPLSAGYASSAWGVYLRAIPAGLQAVLNNMAPAVETQFSDSSFYAPLRYPKALIEDTSPPVVSNFSARSTITNTVLSWNTNEFARCTARYGAESGVYPHTLINELYYQQHALQLLSLAQGATYFVQFTCTDLSGNPATSGELQFTVVVAPVIVEYRVLLPFVAK